MSTRFESEEIYYEINRIQLRITELKKQHPKDDKFEQIVDEEEQEAFDKTIAQYERMIVQLEKIDEIRMKKAKKKFWDCCKKAAKEVASWPKWKREVLS